MFSCTYYNLFLPTELERESSEFLHQGGRSRIRSLESWSPTRRQDCSGSDTATCARLLYRVFLQLDNTALSILSQQEAVSRIKYNPCVTLTILRERVGSPSSLQSEHLYEEILYSDTPHNNTVQQEPEASGTSMGNCESAHHKRRPTKETRVRINTAPELLEQLKVPAAQGRHRSSTAAADPTAVEGRMLVEKVSADSGLSSGSSGSPPHNGRQTRALRHPHLPAAVSNTDFSKDAQGRHSYHNARELKKKLLKNAKAKGLSSSSIATRKTHVEDGYEVEVRVSDN